jgi:hypothetical protein
MEITKVDKTGVTKVTEDLRIRYNFQGEEVNRVSGIIYRDETTVGYFNADRTGVLGFSLPEKNNLTTDEIKQLFNAAVDDAQELFADETE